MQGELSPSQQSIHRQLVEQLEEHAALCGELDAISQRQGQIVAHGEAPAILAVLAERERVIEDLSRCNARIEPLRRVWDSVAGTASKEQRDDVSGRIDALAGLIGAISERDAADRSALEQRRDAVVAELHALNAQKQATGSYGRVESSDARTSKGVTA
ncbi:MAG: hypothetical protein KGS45_10255 [Planctomycetes bacterium]|nr:hypothetical protein [Planctomycetota bacterium]